MASGNGLPDYVRVTLTIGAYCPSIAGTYVFIASPSNFSPGYALWDIAFQLTDGSGNILFSLNGYIHCAGWSETNPDYCSFFGFQGGGGGSACAIGVAFSCGTFVNQTTQLISCDPLKFKMVLYDETNFVTLTVEEF